MSAWARILAAMIARGSASQASLDGALARALITGEEHRSLTSSLAPQESEPGGDLAP